MSKIDLDELSRLEKAATPGPWISTPGMDSQVNGHEIAPSHFGSRATDQWFGTCSKTPYSVYSDGFCDSYVRENNTDLIVSMRNALPSLIAELRAARAVIETVKWTAEGPGFNHGEDCDYWDWEAEKPSGEECTCGYLDSRLAIQAYLEIIDKKDNK